jgi:hypothetical protein
MHSATPKLVGGGTGNGGIVYKGRLSGRTIGNVLLPIDCLSGCVILNVELIVIFIGIWSPSVRLYATADHINLGLGRGDR